MEKILLAVILSITTISPALAQSHVYDAKVVELLEELNHLIMISNIIIGAGFVSIILYLEFLHKK